MLVTRSPLDNESTRACSERLLRTTSLARLPGRSMPVDRVLSRLALIICVCRGTDLARLPGRSMPADRVLSRLALRLPALSCCAEPPALRVPAGATASNIASTGGAAESYLQRGREMISFRLGDDHDQLRLTVADFARDVVAPVIGGYYERREFPYEIVAKMAKLGLFGLPFPEEYGGMGGDYFALCLALHELARVDSSVAITLEAAVSLGAMPIYRFGSQEQRDRWLPDLCQGDRLAAFGLTEPGGGSDIAGGMRTTARLDNGEWVIEPRGGAH